MSSEERAMNVNLSDESVDNHHRVNAHPVDENNNSNDSNDNNSKGSKEEEKKNGGERRGVGVSEGNERVCVSVEGRSVYVTREVFSAQHDSLFAALCKHSDKPLAIAGELNEESDEKKKEKEKAGEKLIVLDMSLRSFGCIKQWLALYVICPLFSSLLFHSYQMCLSILMCVFDGS
jgi:hypothetical protein